ncbi:hypothetical protein F383_02156 [Gossypium arboreum]|uniref:Protein LURP-one-related 12-like n=1 Tax=Gossypium arboreum TaxID=29729 RepID=A0A0B0NXE8_GOSAR|nr:hypothetical protein F383_02156 [Gossypium arboreum]
MASLLTIVKVSWFSEWTRTVLTLVTKPKLFLWMLMEDACSLSEKRPSLHHRWEGFLGERTEGQKPIFSVKRSSIIGRCGMTVEVFNNPGLEYQIEGNFGQRNCTILNAAKESVAEIKRKVDASTNVVLGKDVFLLSLKPGFDGAFAMGLVLVLDQINGDDYVENDEAEMIPTTED